MSVHFITGKLGNGKTLGGVYQLRTHLRRGCPVATNLDIDLSVLLGSKNKTAVVFRLKDRPDVSDFEKLGYAYPKSEPYDESKFGCIVLDECGTWFNTRNWNDKGRKELMDYLLHIRKMRWNVYFIIQDKSMIDKQARDSLGEHIVYMRRTDNIKIPLLTTFIKLLTGIRITFPKMHFGFVKYGLHEHSLNVDTWRFTGKDIYGAYDTGQIFSPNYEHEFYQLLPPYYSKGRYETKHNMRFYMRMTKIYFKQYSKPLILGFGLFCGISLAFAGMSADYNVKESALVETMNEAIDVKTEELNLQVETLKTEKLIAENKIDLLTKTDDKFMLAINAIDFIDTMFLSYRFRLSGYFIANNIVYGYVDFYDNEELKESLSLSQFSSYGWSLTIKDEILKVTKSDIEYIVTSWPTSNKSFNAEPKEGIKALDISPTVSRKAYTGKLDTQVGFFNGKSPD